MKKKVTLGLLLLVNVNFVFADDGCGTETLSELRNEVVQLFEIALAQPYTKAPCKETSTSDIETIKQELKSLVKKVFKGNVPNPVATALKAFITPSQIGTSSELCPVPSPEMETAKYQLEQYNRIVSECTAKD